jgi:hypothetical protein
MDGARLATCQPRAARWLRRGADPRPEPTPSLAEKPIPIDLFMTRIHRSVGLVLALATVGLCANAFAWTSGATAAIESTADTPLPPGWELCVLAGVTAPVTPANIADLDEWQAAEGGSTNNTAAYNPFNTRRTTDTTGAPIPNVASANGFPAFATWQAGCDATVATLFQPNMWPITAALHSGSVAPAAAFLAVVDQSSWCAPSNGVPCYVNFFVGAAGSPPAVLVSSSALDVYGNVKSDLASYQQSITAVTADQSALLTQDQALAATEVQLSANRSQFDAALRALRGFAINEYMSSGLYSGAPLVYAPTGSEPTGPQDSDGVVAQQYLSVAAGNLLSRESAAAGLVKGAIHQRNEASKAVNEAALTLTLDQTAENRTLDRLVKDVATLEHAGACATVTLTAATPGAAAPTGTASTATPTTTPTTSTTVPPTTVPTTVPTTTVPTTVPPTTVPSTIPSTKVTILPTTTVPSSTTTTTPPTTTVPSTTVPSTVPATTEPTTPSATTPQSVNPAGVAALQGCISALAPSTST